MNLDESQRKKVSDWITEGLKLSEIQNRLAAELAVRMTYMEVRMLVDDLKLTPKDVERAKPVSSTLAGPSAPPAAGSRPAASPPGTPLPAAAEADAVPSGLSLSVDQLARPGALVSGKVTFSDGNKAEWYLDQTGRLSLVAQQPGYRPPAADVPQFQAALEAELAKLGF